MVSLVKRQSRLQERWRRFRNSEHSTFSLIKQRLRLRGRWKEFRDVSSAFGERVAIGHVLHKWFGLQRGTEYRIQTPHAIHPLYVRRDSSDIDIFCQIFVEREYGCLDDMADVRLVIDCGANVGYSSAYFLSRHPNCHVMAVEPDSENFAVLQRNLAAYGDRAKLVRAGVWSDTAGLVISQDQYRDGREWTKQVRLCERNEKADIEGVSIETLLAASGYDRISLLKVDVEGAEAVIFSKNYQSWLDKTDAIAIELHDDSTFGKGSDVFFSAIDGRGFQISHSGELTICKRL